MKLAKKLTSAFMIGIMLLISIPITTLAANAAMDFGLGTTFSWEFTKVNVIDFGTIDLSQGEFTAEKNIVIKNRSGESTIEIGLLTVADQYGNIDPFTDNYTGAAWPPVHDMSGNYMGSGSYSSVDDTIKMDVSSFPAGTYYGKFFIKPESGTLSINDGAIQADSEGRYIVPITVTLTGINPNFAAPVQNLNARAGNGAVELIWDEQQDCVSCTYTLYRMEGVPTGAPGQTTDPWEMIAEEIVKDDPRYVDYTAENGKTYSYTVVVGSIGRGNCSTPVTATPSSDYVERLAAPELSVSDHTDGVSAVWNLIVPGQGQTREDIDHFNIYRNGILFSQVDYSAYTEDWVSWYDPQLEQYVTEYNNKWGVILDSEPGVIYLWQLSAVDKNGIEGYLSQPLMGERIDTTPAIDSFEAVYDEYYDDLNDTYIDAVRISVNANSVYNGIRHIDVWRDGVYIGQLKGVISNNSMTVYDINNIQPDQTYNYQIQVTDHNYQVTDPVTFSITTDDEGVTRSIYYQYFAVKHGDTPYFKVFGDAGKTYRLYRNGEVIDTKTGQGEYFIFSDTPDTDGTYFYHIARIDNGGMVVTPDHTFIRNTEQPAIEEKPSAPVVSARVVENGCVSINWTPTAAGGNADGYYIYKTRMKNGEEEFRTDKFSSSDGYWSGYYGSELPQNRYLRLYADKTSFIDDQVSWYNEDWMPVKYWVCAYNQYGVSEPSEIITFEYNGGDAPLNINTEAPGKPAVTAVWDTPKDGVEEQYKDKYRYMYVSWDGPMEGGREDYFEVTFQKKNSSGEYEDSYFSPITTSDRYLYKTELSLNWENSYNDVGSYKVIVTAVNQVDGVEYRTESDPFYFEMGYTPRLTLTGGEDFVQLSWLDPTIDASTEDYEVWRKEEYGLWEKLPVPSGSISYDGTAFSYTDNTVTSRTKYHYYVVRNKNGNERASGEKVVTPMLLPGAPSALTVKRLSGSDMLVSWNAPTNGGSVGGYIIQAYYDYDGGTWEDIYTIHTPTTSCFEYIYMDRIRVVAFNDGGRGPASEEFVTTDLPENTASEYPPYVWPDSTSGDATVTVTWEHNNYTGDSATQYFEIVRSKNDETKQKVAIIPADPSRTSYSWTDPDVENGNHYEYWVHACNSQGYKTNTGGWGGVLEYSTWASPEGETPNSDQIVAQTVEDLISELPDPDVLDPEDADAVSQIREVQSIYEGLTDAQLQEINEAERQKIEALIEMLDHADAEDKYEGNTAVASVEELIANLPATEDITVDSLNEDLVAQVTEARQGYAALPDDAKRIVDTAKLDAAEQKIRQLQKQAADREIVENVIAEIEALPAPDQVTIDNAQQVTSQTDWARTLYNSLTPSQKTLMAGMERGAAAIEKLDSLEEVLELLKVSEEDRTAAATVTALVDSIKDIPELTAADEASVTSARNAYNNLTADQKKLISAETLTKLEEAEGRILLLKAADQVIRMINDLPAITEIRVEDAEQIEAARAAYEALTEEAKELVPDAKVDALEDAETEYQDLLDNFG